MKVKDYTIYAYARYLRLFSCHTCCDKGPRFLLSHPQDLPTLIDILQRTFLTQIPTGTHASEANQVNIFGSVELGTASKNHFLIKAETQTTRNMKYSWPAIQTQASCGECRPHPKTNILCNVLAATVAYVDRSFVSHAEGRVFTSRLQRTQVVKTSSM